jgi:branched-chain amino acid transport system ATP-binding protein
MRCATTPSLCAPISAENGRRMLEVQALVAGYQGRKILDGVSLYVGDGEQVAIVGPNGAGKTTLLRAICGLLRPWSGGTIFAGTTLHPDSPPRNLERGVVLLPQGGKVFDGMSVKENLELGAYLVARAQVAQRLEEVLDLFPGLRAQLYRDAGRLSGGEQQMLSLARALLTRPRLLLLDEPSLGLAPRAQAEVFDKIAALSAELGLGVLMVEQRVRAALELCQRAYGLKLGRIELEASTADLIADGGALRALFLS